jgi:hypothetical protein
MSIDLSCGFLHILGGCIFGTARLAVAPQVGLCCFRPWELLALPCAERWPITVPEPQGLQHLTTWSQMKWNLFTVREVVADFQNKLNVSALIVCISCVLFEYSGEKMADAFCNCSDIRGAYRKALLPLSSLGLLLPGSPPEGTMSTICVPLRKIKGTLSYPKKNVFVFFYIHNRA